MKPVPYLLAALAAVLLLVGAPAAAFAATGATKTDPTTGMTKAQTADYLASHASETAKANNAKDAARRAKGSAFERQTLDQKAFQSPTTTKHQASSGSGSIVRMLFGLLVVGGLIFTIHFLLKRWGKSRALGGGAGGVIDILATTQLAQGRAVHLIRVGSEVVLVGATDHSITRLGEVDQRSLGLAGVGTPETGSFTSLLEGAISAPIPLTQIGSVSAPTPATTSTKDSFVGRFVENLKLNTAR